MTTNSYPVGHIPRAKFNSTQERVDFQVSMIGAYVWQTCLNCEFWLPNSLGDGKEEKCTKYGARPPLLTIVTGCREWSLLVPF